MNAAIGRIRAQQMVTTSMKRRGGLLLLAFIAALPAAHAQSGKWPERPVRVIVPFPPGDSPDVVARLLAPRLLEEFGQQFVVDNRAGASGTIGSEIAARATPDGYTLAVVAVDAMPPAPRSTSCRTTPSGASRRLRCLPPDRAYSLRTPR